MQYDKAQFEINGTILKKYKGKETTAKIPHGVTEIGDSAFEECKSLQNIIIPDSVTTVGRFAFIRCGNLLNVEIPNGVAAIGADSFFGCESLISVHFPASIKFIDEVRFPDCKNLESITVDEENPVYHSSGNCIIKTASKTLIAGCNTSVIPVDGSVTKIEKLAFNDCAKLTELNIPKCVTSIGYGAFMFCDSLKTINFEGTQSEWRNISNNAAVPDGCTVNCNFEIAKAARATGINLGTYRPQGKDIPQINLSNYNRAEFDIENGVIKAYKGGNPQIDIPYGVTEIEKEAFSGLTHITKVNIPDSVTKIGGKAFKDCIRLANINIPDSVTEIGSSAFENTEIYNNVNNWEDVIFSSDGYNTNIEHGFLYIDNFLIKAINTVGNPRLTVLGESYEIKYGTRVIADMAFSHFIYLSGITIPDTVTHIGAFAFADRGISEVKFGNGVVKIDFCAFMRCYNLRDITLPDSLLSIGSDAFSGCSSIEEIRLPDNLQSIDSLAFKNCTELKEITVPESVTKIDSAAFKGCKQLKTIEYGGTKKQWKTISKGIKKPLFCKVICKGDLK